MKLEVTESSHQQACLEFYNPTQELRTMIRRTLLNNRMDSDDYKARKGSTPFLQCDSLDYILVEFWGPTPHVYTEYLQGCIDEEFGVEYVGTTSKLA